MENNYHDTLNSDVTTPFNPLLGEVGMRSLADTIEQLNLLFGGSGHDLGLPDGFTVPLCRSENCDTDQPGRNLMRGEHIGKRLGSLVWDSEIGWHFVP